MTRVVNKKHSDYDVYIGRGSLFGNPWSHRDSTLAKHVVSTREEAISKYREYFMRRVEEEPLFRKCVMMLKGQILGCSCAPKPCHGDVIVEFLEGPPDCGGEDHSVISPHECK